MAANRGTPMSPKAKHTVVIVLSWVFMGAGASYVLANHGAHVAISAHAAAN